MVDEVVSSVAPAAVESAPVVSANVETPVAPTGSETVAPVEAPEATVLGDDAAPVEAKPVETAPVTTDVKPIESKPVDVKPDVKPVDGADKTQPEAEKKDESSQSDEPASLPSYEPWKFPDTMTVDEAQVAETNKLFGEFEQEARKDPHAAMQKFGQQLIDRYVTGVQTVADQIASAYKESWKAQTKGWYDSFVQEFGDKKDEVAAASREFIRRHGGTPEQQAEVRTLMQNTGIGNHPAVIRMLAAATANLSEGKPVPAGAPPAQPQSRKQRFYGKKGQ